MSYEIVLSGPGRSRILSDLDDLKMKITRDNHGDKTATFQICDWLGNVPIMDDRLSIYDSVHGYVWSGYLASPQMPHPVNGGPILCEARGWRHTISDDGWDVTKVWADGTPLTTVVQEALSKCTHIGTGVPLPGGLAFQLSQDSQEFILRAPDDVFDFVTNKFKYLTTPLLWEIRQNQSHPHNEDPSFHMRFADLAPRYFITLTKEDEFGPRYDRDTVFNKAIVGWDAHQAEDVLAQPAAQLYDVIQTIRAKRVSGTNELNTSQEANSLGQFLIQRNNTLRPVNSTLKVHCDTPIRAEYPTVASSTPNVPHYAVLSNYIIRIENNLTDWGPYGVTDYWISDVSYDFDSDELTLSLGDPIAYDDFALQQSYQTNRVQSAVDSGIVNEPLRDADVIPVYGPNKAGDTPPTIGEGIPMHYVDQAGALPTTNTDITKPTAKNGALVHPNLIPDYGIHANFGREADSIGVKGFIKVVPCIALLWEVDFTPAAGSDTVPTSSITIELYAVYPPVVSTNVLATCIVSSAQSASGAIAPTPASLAVFAQGGKIGVRVSSASTTTGIGFQVTISGKRLYPHLGVTS